MLPPFFVKFSNKRTVAFERKISYYNIIKFLGVVKYEYKTQKPVC